MKNEMLMVLTVVMLVVVIPVLVTIALWFFAKWYNTRKMKRKAQAYIERKHRRGNTDAL